jgi:23S rRNA (guanine1835-N2)-methyltransferase
METLHVPQGSFELARYPRETKDPLRAWDAADEYLLQQLHEQRLPQKQTNLGILNDSFGALSLALANHRPWMISDSWLSRQGTQENLKYNNLPTNQILLLSSLHPMPEHLDLILIKTPKNLALLEYQLHQLRPALHKGSIIMGAGMSKHIHKSTLQLFERIIGPTHTSLARKKARLIHSRFDTSADPGTNPWPKQYKLENTTFTITNHANVFSSSRLDIGSRFFLQHLPRLDGAGHIIDLGCGNGVVGLVAAHINPQAKLMFVDESYMAVASAETNFSVAFGHTGKAEFMVNDGLDRMPADSADLILLNPPFHQQHAIGDTTAWRMFRQSRHYLKSGGELRIIGNRHLGYQAKLKRLFGNCSLIASNSKFVICSAVKK